MSAAYGSDGISPDLLLKMTVRRITETLYEYSETLITALCASSSGRAGS